MTLALSPGRLAQVACVIEVTARKPGNVHRYRDFDDTTYLDFVLSALAIGPALDRAAREGVGTAVRAAISATRGVVDSNTNLGMVLLLAPLAAVPPGVPLREGVAAVLRGTTVADARAVYEAIRLAEAGGLGSVPEQDVADAPTATLLDAMRLAADRDAVARQYAEDYDDVFSTALPALTDTLEAGHPLETAVIVAHLSLMATRPDTLILRKRGDAEARESSLRARAVLDQGWPDRPEAARALDELDVWLRAVGHARNPGASADLVAAALFAALRDGTISLPLSSGKGRPTWWPLTL